MSNRAMTANEIQPEWKEELAAIIGARAHGQAAEILPRLRALDARHPNIGEINHQLAWTCDTLEHDAEALQYYEKAVALGLRANDLAGALLGLGAVLRRLGHLDRSAAVLRTGQVQFPANREFDIFLALTLHHQGRHAAALQLALEVLCATTDDPGVTAWQRAIRHEAGRLP
jgi:tetratricopeptide (TPR) repeat protein